MPFYVYDLFMTERRASIPVGSTWAPSLLRIQNGQLEFAGNTNWIKRRAPKDLLARFVSIAEAADTELAVRKFVTKWGLIRLCGHGIPRHHSPHCNLPEETVTAYKNFSLCLGALQRIGLEINAGNVGADLDWELADVILVAEDFPPLSDLMRKLIRGSIETARTHFQQMMRVLVTVTELQPRFCWVRNAWSIDFDCHRGSNLGAILAIQLMAQIGGAAMKKCRNCPRWFQPQGRQLYCSSCGIRAAWRAATTRYRKRITLADTLASQGKKPRQKRR